MKVANLLLLFTLIGLMITGCSGKDPEQITITTGGVSGTYYPLGEALDGIIDSAVDGAEASAVSSDGSVANVRAIAAGEADLALVQNDIADYAYNGTEMFAGDKVDNIRGVAAWYPETIQFIALRESGISTVSELKGKKVGVGAPGSGTMVEAMSILNVAGIDRRNTDILEMDFSEVVSALLDGTIDAGCVVAGIPTQAVLDIAESHQVQVLEITDDVLDALGESCPFLVPQVVPAGTYDGLDSDASTVAVMAMLAVSDDLSEDLVYSITKAMFENLETLVLAHVRAADIDLSTAMEGVSIPLHPGALKYYSEKGMTE